MPHLKAFGRLAIEYGRLTAASSPIPGEERLARAAYRALLGRDPQAHELATCVAEMRSGDLKVGGLATRIMAGAEYQARFAPPPAAPALDPAVEQAYARVVAAAGAEASDEQFVYAAYQALLDRMPDWAGLETARDGLHAGAITRRDLVAGLLTSDEYRELEREAAGPTDAQLYTLVLAETGPEVSDEDFLRAAYPVVLKRPADDSGVGHFLRLLQRNATTRQDLIRSMIASAEYQRALGKTIKPMAALHQMRMQLFQQYLPPARRVLDLGGAAHNHAEGALLLMGYPHRPDQITIVDLPPDARIGGAAAAEGQHEIVTGDGIRIQYLYRSMADLADLPDAGFDLIVSGESIEHISQAEAEVVCREAFRLLAPGGSFCLDTPNAAITRLQMPDQFIHPEHQKEYLVDEIRQMLTRNGFRLAAQKALCPMPESLRSRTFDRSELSRNMSISDTPEEGYAFFVHAQKPEA